MRFCTSKVTSYIFGSQSNRRVIRDVFGRLHLLLLSCEAFVAYNKAKDASSYTFASGMGLRNLLRVLEDILLVAVHVRRLMRNSFTPLLFG